MIYRRGQKVLVQGITGKQGSFWATKMMECGTDIVAGVNPKRAGEQHLGTPIFRSAVEATKQTPCDISVIFIPPAMAKAAIIDAIDADVVDEAVATDESQAAETDVERDAEPVQSVAGEADDSAEEAAAESVEQTEAAVEGDEGVESSEAPESSEPESEGAGT